MQWDAISRIHLFGYEEIIELLFVDFCKELQLHYIYLSLASFNFGDIRLSFF